MTAGPGDANPVDAGPVDVDPERTLVLAPAVAREVFAHTLEEAPDECCGILVGPNALEASEAVRAKNVHANPRTRYTIDPDTLLEVVVRTEDDRGLGIVGFYHSHPRGYAAFSHEDQARGSWDGAAYLLVSLAPATFLAGRWEDGAFSPLDVRIGCF